MSPYKPSGIKKIYHDVKRRLALIWLSKLHPVQIAITGSQGKTNTTEIVSHVLSRYGRTVRTDQNLDTTYNVPITAFHVNPLTRFLVWELGIDHPGEMAQHLQIAHPHIACVTGISPVHTDHEHMGSLEILIREKRKLIEAVPINGTVILNHDNEYTRTMAPHTKAPVKWFGTTPNCDMWTDPETIKLTLNGTTARCYVNKGNTSRAMQIQTGLVGGFHLYNIMAAYLICQEALPHKDFDEVFTHVVSDMKPLPGRMSIEEGPLETILINDSLRASPQSTRAGLEALNKIEYSGGRKIAVIGEMGELADPENEHRMTGKQIAQMKFDYVICLGPLRKYTIEDALLHGLNQKQIAYAADVFEAAELLKTVLKAGDLWYLKGSLLRNYGRILTLLRGEKVCCHEILCPYDHCK